MRDHDRNQDNRYRNRDREVSLDDRTGVGIGSPGGYPARFDTDRDDSRSGYREQNYNMRYDEGPSFRDPDYDRHESRFYSSRGGYGRSDYQRGENRNRSGAYSYPLSQGQDFYAAGDFYAGPGYGERTHGRDRSLEAYRGQGYAYDRPRGRREHGFWERMGDKLAAWFGDDSDYEFGESHRGKGPKGYRRSDDRIREDVSDRLADDHWLDASAIEVSVANCDVTLTGTVKSRDDKRRAEAMAETVSGVDHVQNNLRVERTEDWRADASTASRSDKLGGAAAGKA